MLTSPLLFSHLALFPLPLFLRLPPSPWSQIKLNTAHVCTCFLRLHSVSSGNSQFFEFRSWSLKLCQAAGLLFGFLVWREDVLSAPSGHPAAPHSSHHLHHNHHWFPAGWDPAAAAAAVIIYRLALGGARCSSSESRWVFFLSLSL